MVLYLTEGILNESVGGDKVIESLNKRIAVLINYADKDSSHTGKRYIEPYVYGLTKKGNPAIRAYQYWGDTKRGVPKWKLFRLDRIISWEPTEEVFDLEPNARGWAAEAFNNNGDGSLIEIFKIVDLKQKPLTDYEKLKARTRKLQNSKPVNINDFLNKKNQTNTGPVEPIQTEAPQQGPITGDTTNPTSNKPEDLMGDDNFMKMLQRNLEITAHEKNKKFKRPANPEPEIDSNIEEPVETTPVNSGPIIDNNKETPNQSANNPMDSDEFRKMLQRNLEITAQEKSRRRDKKLNNK